MFAVFYKNEFKNWWLNQRSDEGWVETTCTAMGWNPKDVEVYWFDRANSPGEVLQFPEPGTLSVLEAFSADVPDGEGKTKTVTAWREKESWTGQKFFPKGA